MKTYGLKRGQRGCCPGHDDFPRETYNSRRSTKAHTKITKIMRRKFRRTEKMKMHDKYMHIS